MKPISCQRILDCFGTARLAMTNRSRRGEPKAEQSRVCGQLIGFMESLH